MVGNKFIQQTLHRSLSAANRGEMKGFEKVAWILFVRGGVEDAAEDVVARQLSTVLIEDVEASGEAEFGREAPNDICEEEVEGAEKEATTPGRHAAIGEAATKSVALFSGDLRVEAPEFNRPSSSM